MPVAPTTISLLPELPSSSASANFASKGDAVIDALNSRIVSLNSSNTNIYTNSLEVDTAKSLADNLDYYRADNFTISPISFTGNLSSGNTVNFVKQGELTGLISQNVTTDNTTKPRVLVTWEPLEERVSAVSFSGKLARTAGGSTVSASGLTFDSTGARLYFCVQDPAGILVIQHTLMQPWDISTRRYNGQYFLATEPGTNTSTPIRFSSDGTKFYISATAGSTGYSKIYQYDLGTPWEVKTAVFNNKISPYLTSSTGVAGFGGFFIGNNGSSLFVLFNNEELRQYVLSTAWDISTAIALNQTALSGITTQGRGFVFDSTGTILMVVEDSGLTNAVHRYNLSTAWNVTTISSVAQTFSVAPQTSSPFDIYFKSDGLSFYVLSGSGSILYNYTTSSAWTISSGVSLSSSAVYNENYVVPPSLFFSSDGLKVFLDDPSSLYNIISYDLSVAWDISTISNKKTLNTANYTTKITLSSTGNYVFYTNGSFITRIPLSTPWDLNSAGSAAAVDSGTTTLTCLAFSQDGTKMYIGPYSGVIRQYTLSPAWSLSGFVYANKALDYKNELVTCDHIAFSPDGTSILVSGYNGSISFASRTIVQYKLSTAWDLSTAVFLTYGAKSKALVSSGAEFSTAADFAYLDTPGQAGSRLIVCGAGTIYNYYYVDNDENKIEKPYSLSTMTLSQDSAFTGIAFNDTGTKMFLAGDSNNRIYEYSLNNAFNPTSGTVSYTGNSLALTHNGPSAIRFSSDGTKLFVSDGSNYAIYQYTLSTPWSIATASSTPSVSLDTAPAGSFLSGMCFSADGTKLFISVSANSRIRVYNLPTAWSLTGATLSIDFINISTFMEEGYPGAIDISPDGKNIFVLRGSSQRFVYRIELSTPYDLRTATLSDPLSGGYVKFFKTTEPGFVAGIPRAFDFKKSDGSSLYVTDGYWLQEYYLGDPYNLGKIYNKHFALGTYTQTTYPYNVTSTLLPVTIDYSSTGKDYVVTSTSGQAFTITTLPPKAENSPLNTFNITLVNRDSAPLSNSPGTVGQAYIDDYYFYLYTGLQSGWKRAAISLL